MGELRDFRELLPQGTPVSHCLKIRHALAKSNHEAYPVIPDVPAWKWPARVLANGLREQNLYEKSTIAHEFDLVVGSLFLAFSIGALLSPPTSCANSERCPNLLATDLLLWAVLTASLLVCVVNAWTCFNIENTVSN